jgi:hypothetical protein
MIVPTNSIMVTIYMLFQGASKPTKLLLITIRLTFSAVNTDSSKLVGPSCWLLRAQVSLQIGLLDLVE